MHDYAIKSSIFTKLGDFSLSYRKFSKFSAPAAPNMSHSTQFPQKFQKFPFLAPSAPKNWPLDGQSHPPHPIRSLVDTIEEATLVRKEITDILGGMNMKVRKLASKSCEILDTILPGDRYTTLNDSNNMISKDTKCLGVAWSPSKDMLHYESYNTLMTKKKPKFTKRGISSIVPALYDPAGLIQPYIVEGKICFQKTWTYRDAKGNSLKWEDPLLRRYVHKLDKSTRKNFLCRISQIFIS